MYILEAVPDFVKILGYGLSGFAFLLMFFAYMLLRQVISKGSQNKMIYKSIWAFMGLSFLLTICIGVFSFVTGDYKKKELQENETTIQNQQNGLEVLKIDQKLDSLVKNAVVGNIENNPAKAEATKTAHDKIITDLQTGIDKANATPEDKKKFKDLANETTKTLDSLNRSDLSHDTKVRLTDKYIIQTGELSRVSTNVIKRNMLTSPVTKRQRE